MKKRKRSHARGMKRLLGSGVAALGIWGSMTLAVWGRNTHRRSRKLNQPNDEAERPPISDEQRSIEPFGVHVAWAQLDPLDGRYMALPYDLSRQIILLGRQGDCDIILTDDRASRYHAVLTWDRGSGYVNDNSSKNGTSVNGQRVIGPFLLRQGDIIEAGGEQFRFSYTEVTGLVVFDAQPTEKIALPGLPPSKPLMPKGRLTVQTGPEHGRVWPVAAGVVGIGRGSDNLIVIPHLSVSRHHALIVVQSAGIFIQDISQSNPISVNGEPLTAPRALEDGDHIQVGDILLVFSMELAPARDIAPEEQPTQRLPRSEHSAPMRPENSTPSLGSSQFRHPLRKTQPLPSGEGRRVPRFQPAPKPEES